MNEQIFTLADRLKDAKERKKELDAMEVERFSRNGSTFYLSTRLYASPQAGRKDEMMQALKDNGYGSIVVETVNANTLASFVKEQKAANDDEVPEWLSDVVSVFEKMTVGVRKG